jgi:hypothetical protein
MSILAILVSAQYPKCWVGRHLIKRSQCWVFQDLGWQMQSGRQPVRCPENEEGHEHKTIRAQDPWFGSWHSSCFDSSKPYSGWFYHAPVQQVTFQLIFSSTSICINLGNHISPHKTLNQTPLQRTLQQAMRPQGLRSPRLLMLPRQLWKYPSPRALVEPKVPPTQQRLWLLQLLKRLTLPRWLPAPAPSTRLKDLGRLSPLRQLLQALSPKDWVSLAEFPQ